MIFEIITLIILLLLSGIFSGLETAFSTITHIQIKKLSKKDSTAKIIDKLKDNPKDLITTILICNNLINIGASAFTTYVVIKFFGSTSIGISTGILTFLILVFGEVTPKKLALDYNEKVCLYTARPLLFLVYALWPIRFIINKMSSIILVFFGERKEKPKMTEEDIIHAIEIGEEIGELESQEKTMINRIFKFNDLEVKDIMCPIKKVFSINQKEKVQDKIKLIMKKGYSRIPIYGKNKKDIVGILFIKDILKFKEKEKISSIMKKPFFVLETKKIDDMLAEFKKRKTHLAIVRNKKEKVLGIVSIEDVLEKLVGKIYDETDKLPKNTNKKNK